MEKEPIRSNSSYNFIYIEKSMGLDAIFHEILTELKEKKQQAKRTIVFCQTRKQCALIYRLFVVALGNGLYMKDMNPKLV